MNIADGTWVREITGNYLVMVMHRYATRLLFASSKGDDQRTERLEIVFSDVMLHMLLFQILYSRIFLRSKKEIRPSRAFAHS